MKIKIKIPPLTQAEFVGSYTRLCVLADEPSEMVIHKKSGATAHDVRTLIAMIMHQTAVLTDIVRDSDGLELDIPAETVIH